MKRLAQNSKSLQKNFSQIYRNFFIDCEKVVSASNSFFWSGEFLGFYGGMTILQKLPFKVYVGLEPIEKDKIEFPEKYLTFIPPQQQFEEALIEEKLRQNILEYFQKQGLWGYKVKILAEYPLGGALGTGGGLAAALATLVQLKKRKIKKEDLENFSKTALKKLITEQKFNQLFRQAWEIAALNQAGRSSGAVVFASMVSGEYPVVYQASQNKFWAAGLDELFDLPSHPIWPIDFGLIYTGRRVNSEAVILAIEQVKTRLEKSSKEASKILPKTIKIKDNFWRTYLQMMQLISVQNLLSFSDLFQKGQQKEVLSSFYATLNQYQNMIRLLEVTTAEIDQIYQALHAKLKSGVKISGVGKGGDLVFATEVGGLESDIFPLIEELREKTDKDIWLDYATFLDGKDVEGLKLEQDITSGIYHAKIESGTYHLAIFEGERPGFEKVLTAEKFEKEMPHFDLVLNEVEGKILILGQSLNSKVLPSQKATIEILKKLFLRKNRRVKNTELQGSYAQNRYDLQGKIVLPLCKILKQKARKSFNLKVSGGMYDDFELSLESSNVKVGIVEKVL